MKIILLRDIARVGRKGEIKQVADGYGKFLIAEGKAELETAKALARHRQALERNADHDRLNIAAFNKAAESLQNVTVTIGAKASETGHLFASLHKDEIIAAIKAQTGVAIAGDWLQLEKPLKEIGTFSMPLVLGNNRGDVTIVVASA